MRLWDVFDTQKSYFSNTFLSSLAKTACQKPFRLDHKPSQFVCHSNLPHKFQVHDGEQIMYNCRRNRKRLLSWSGSYKSSSYFFKRIQSLSPEERPALLRSNLFRDADVEGVGCLEWETDMHSPLASALFSSFFRRVHLSFHRFSEYSTKKFQSLWYPQLLLQIVIVLNA